MERAAQLNRASWPVNSVARDARTLSTRVFVSILVGCACLSAFLAGWLPLQVSVITVFLFAGPHNWFELRYFLMRLPLRFGKSRNFFLVAFAGIGLLTLSYIALPVLYSFSVLPDRLWPTVLASWNTLMLLWVAALVFLRGKNKLQRHRAWVYPIIFALCSLNWLAPEFFSLGIVYLHPLIALWFFDRHLSRTRSNWLPVYRRCLCLLPILLLLMFWQLGQAQALPDDNGLFWRITQHAGAQLLPNVSSRLLVGTHVFLEMLHYGVWLVALPLIAPLSKNDSRKGAAIWDVRSVPVARHPRGFPKLVTTALALGAFVVLLLWLGFSADYATTRDIYFTVAIAHVLAEAPFLLRMI
jgi:hypothetical protein